MATGALQRIKGINLRSDCVSSVNRMTTANYGRLYNGLLPVQTITDPSPPDNKRSLRHVPVVIGPYISLSSPLSSECNNILGFQRTNLQVWNYTFHVEPPWAGEEENNNLVRGPSCVFQANVYLSKTDDRWKHKKDEI